MKNKEKYFLDLSKLNKEQQKHIVSLLPEPKYSTQYQILEMHYILHLDTELWWVINKSTVQKSKTELTYSEFIGMFEGEEEPENNGWISVETKPDKFQDVILYREDAGVFTGYYGNLAETLSETAIEQHYDEGVSEDTMWKEQFFYFGIDGNGILELDTEPTHWMPLPEPPKP